ncbi:MAG: NAD-dependent epimerase/dehydratase family protein [Deltaproteobacteria bacterium]|nr:MAG: NAD-dependent epimerase/dehydratase family protein [Deltaproteobacteria bacterium]
MTGSASGELRARTPAGPVDVLVTGAAGFVGRALVARLEAEGLAVQGTDVVAGAAPTVHLDVTDGAEVMDVFGRLRPRMVVHTAALVDVGLPQSRAQQVNVVGTENVLDAAAACDVQRFVHVSSIAALGLDPGQGAGPDSPLVFDTGEPYFDTKAAAEALVRQAMERNALPAVVVRPGDVYGPGCEPWVERPLGLLRRSVPVLVGGGDGLIAHTWIDNLVDGLLLACTHDGAVGRVFQLTDGVDDTTLKAYLTRLAAAAGLKPPRAGLPGFVGVGAGVLLERFGRLTGRTVPFTRQSIRYLMRKSTYDITAAREGLDYAPAVGLDEGFSRLAHALARG